MSEKFEDNMHYREWFDAGGSRSPSIKFALQWMYVRMQKQNEILTAALKESQKILADIYNKENFVSTEEIAFALANITKPLTTTAEGESK